jgi:hypothetical protein
MQDPAAAGVGRAPILEGEPAEEEMIETGPAAEILGKSPRTVERWVDAGKLPGGRPTNPLTGEPIEGSHRWVDARHAVLIAVGAGRAHLVPEQWRYLIPLPDLPASRSPSEA